MLTENHIIAFCVLGCGLGIALTIAATFIKHKIVGKVATTKEPITNFNKRVTPFIEIHRSLIEESDTSIHGDASDQFKSKIESFKERNKFYKD